MNDRIFVVDSNYLRSPMLRDMVRSRRNYFVIPDLVMFEATKMESREERESTLRTSLFTLSQIPNQVYMGKPISDLIREEFSSGKAKTSWKDMIFDKATPILRSLLDAVRNNTTNEVMQEIIEDPTGHLREMNADYLLHEKNKRDQLDLLLKGVIPELRKEFVTELRRRKVSDSEIQYVTFYRAPSLLFEMLYKHMSLGSKKALDLVNQNSVCLRYLYTRYWLALTGIAGGALSNRSPEQVSNDLIDSHNVILATGFGGFLSHDKRANLMYHAIAPISCIPHQYRYLWEKDRLTIGY